MLEVMNGAESAMVTDTDHYATTYTSIIIWGWRVKPPILLH